MCSFTHILFLSASLIGKISNTFEGWLGYILLMEWADVMEGHGCRD